MSFTYDVLDSISASKFVMRNQFYPVPWRSADILGSDNRKSIFDKENQIYLFDCGAPNSQRELKAECPLFHIPHHTFALIYDALLENEIVTMEVYCNKGEPSGYDVYIHLTNLKIPELYKNKQNILCDTINSAFQCAFRRHVEITVNFEELDRIYKNY